MVFDQFEGVVFVETYRDHDIYWIGEHYFYGIVSPDGTEWKTFPQGIDTARKMIDNTYPPVEEEFVPFLEPDRYWIFQEIYGGFRVIKYMPGSTHYAAYLGNKWYVSKKGTISDGRARIWNDIINYNNQTTIPVDIYLRYRDIMVYRQVAGSRWYTFEVPDFFFTCETYAECTAAIDKYLGPEPPPSQTECSVLFTVVDALGTPLEGASVSLNGLTGTTDHQGIILFSGLALKTYGWSTSLADYVTQSGQIECTETVTYGIQVTLSAVTPTPPPPPVESLLPAIGSALTGLVLVAVCL